jgi:hypothetical protein
LNNYLDNMFFSYLVNMLKMMKMDNQKKVMDPIHLDPLIGKFRIDLFQ